MALMILTNGRVYLDGAWKTGLDILVEGEKIADIRPGGTCQNGRTVDVQGGYLSPGFIDIHIHGSNGSDVMDARADSLENISTFLAGNGTTSWLATTMTQTIPRIQSALHTVSEYMQEKSHKGAQILGAHMEGPFLNPLAKGAHVEECIIPPDRKTFEEITAETPDIVRLMTLAPEREGALEFADYLKDRGIVVSIGHTKASYDQCVRAMQHGITHICHFYNAMTPLKHREPGTVGAILDNDSATIELIADLIHIHPAALRLAVRVKGPDRTVLITDAMSAAGLRDGNYELGGLPVHVTDGAARLKDGTLAGSVLTQNRALCNMIKIGIPSEDVIAMLTETPAREIGVDGYKGKLRKGYDADINVLDADFQVRETFVRGKKFSK